jgi:hypothetical protein
MTGHFEYRSSALLGPLRKQEIQTIVLSVYASPCRQERTLQKHSARLVLSDEGQIRWSFNQS